MGAHSYEAAIMDLHDCGVRPIEIRAQTGYALTTICNTISRLRVGSGIPSWQAGAVQGSAALLRAIKRHHPERCGA